MAFKIVQSDTYKWPVKIVLPAESGGRRETHAFDAIFKRLPQTRINEIIAEIKRTEYSDEEEGITDIEACKEMLVGWSNVVDDDGELPFTQDSLNAMLNIPTVASQIIKAWFGSQESAKRKN